MSLESNEIFISHTTLRHDQNKAIEMCRIQFLLHVSAKSHMASCIRAEERMHLLLIDSMFIASDHVHGLGCTVCI